MPKHLSFLRCIALAFQVDTCDQKSNKPTQRTIGPKTRRVTYHSGALGGSHLPGTSQPSQAPSKLLLPLRPSCVAARTVWLN